MQGIIVENISNKYIVKCEEKLYNCSARGKLKQEKNVEKNVGATSSRPQKNKEIFTIAVGDIVDIEILDKEKRIAVINDIIERKTYIKRPKISNISQIIYVISSKHPNPDLLMLDKQLAYAEFMNIKPIIILNKIDLENCEKIEEIYNKIGYKVIKTNALENIGIDEVKEVLKNNISVFSGNSGVGKSTLINSIFNSAITESGDISIRNKRGKNTTTFTKLYEIDKNSYIADTPGFSTFDIDEIETTDLDKYFIEFKEEIQKCEYIGCTHIKEENCGVKKALKEDKIAISRYENYKKIYENLKEKEEHKW